MTLTLDAHNVALPSDIPTDDSNTYKIYDTHTPEVSLDDNSGVNELLMVQSYIYQQHRINYWKLFQHMVSTTDTTLVMVIHKQLM